MTTPAAPTAALLPTEPVLLVQARLARALGLAPALFLQQVHYWLQRSAHEHEGRPWIYNTYRQWQVQFPFFSEDQIARAVQTLRGLGVLLVAHLDPDRRDRRNWYSIDYIRLDAVLAEADPPAAVLPEAPGVAVESGNALTAVTPLPESGKALGASAPPAAPCIPRECATRTRQREMDAAPTGPHPEITRSEISQRDPQEEEDGAPVRQPDPPPPPCEPEAVPRTDDAPPAPAEAEQSAAISALAATTWAAYRDALDRHAPPALRTRIAADLQAAHAAGQALTERGLAYALAEAATARGPCWPYLLAVWKAHPDGPIAGEGQSADGGPPLPAPARPAYRDRPSSPYARPGARRPPAAVPLDPAKYLAPGGKYAHLFNRAAPAGAL